MGWIGSTVMTCPVVAARERGVWASGFANRGGGEPGASLRTASRLALFSSSSPARLPDAS
jgi:hypothetical protein